MVLAEYVNDWCWEIALQDEREEIVEFGAEGEKTGDEVAIWLS